MASSLVIPVWLCWCLSGWYILDSCRNLTLISLSVALGANPSTEKASLEAPIVLFSCCRRRRWRGGGEGGGLFDVLLGSGVGLGMLTPGLFSFSILWFHSLLLRAMLIQLHMSPCLSSPISSGSRIRSELTIDFLLVVS